MLSWALSYDLLIIAMKIQVQTYCTIVNHHHHHHFSFVKALNINLRDLKL